MEAPRDSPYSPLASRASWAKGLLLLAGAVDIVAVLTGFALYKLAGKAPSGTVTLEQFQVAEDRHDLVILIQMGVYLVAGVVFIRWFYRAYANLPRSASTSSTIGRAGRSAPGSCRSCRSSGRSASPTRSGGGAIRRWSPTNRTARGAERCRPSSVSGG